MAIRTRKVLKISRKKIIILVLVVIAILGFIFLKQENRSIYNTIALPAIDGSSGSVSAPSNVPRVDIGNQYETSSIKDTREFMKVTYGADIKTRDVKSAIRDVKNAINEADGRIDNLNETTKYSYVSFVIPKNNLSNFKDAIESITNEKLIMESSSSQNLLGQKQTIEQETQTVNITLTRLQNEQKDLTTRHTQTVRSFQKQVTDTQKQLIAVRAEISNTSDSDKLNALRNQEYTLSQQEASLQQNLNSENTSYSTNYQNFKNQIADVNTQIGNIKKEDTNFTDNVETVSGYVSVNWISLWDMATLLSPIHPSIILIILLLLAWYYLTRKNYLPHIELE